MSLHSCYRTGRLPGEKPMYGTLLNPYHPLSQGLVGCWLFNEGGGNKVFDSSGNGNHGNFGGGTLSYAPSWVAGRTGPALDFDGTDDYVDCGNDSSLKPSQITICAWIKPNNHTDWGHIYGSHYEYGAWLSFDVDEMVNLYVKKAGSSYQTWLDITASLLGESHFISAVVTNGTKAYLYLDGSLAGEHDFVSGDLDWVGTTSIRIGRLQYDYYPFNGTIDEVRIYNRALSAAEIWQLYDEQYPLFYHPMEAELLYAVPAAYARSYGYIIGF